MWRLPSPKREHIPDRYPVPHIQDFTSGLADTKIFSAVDLIRGYHQIPVKEEDIPKTAIITPFGLFEFLRMLFGLKKRSSDLPAPYGYCLSRFGFCIRLPR